MHTAVRGSLRYTRACLAKTQAKGRREKSEKSKRKLNSLWLRRCIVVSPYNRSPVHQLNLSSLHSFLYRFDLHKHYHSYQLPTHSLFYHFTNKTPTPTTMLFVTKFVVAVAALTAGVSAQLTVASPVRLLLLGRSCREESQADSDRPLSFSVSRSSSAGLDRPLVDHTSSPSSQVVRLPQLL